MFSLYERLMVGDDVAFEDALTDTWRGIPWMDADGVKLLRQAAAVWRAALAGGVADIGLMAEAFLGLANLAEAAGDD